jgi:hypothetical protein
MLYSRAARGAFHYPLRAVTGQSSIAHASQEELWNDAPHASFVSGKQLQKQSARGEKKSRASYEKSKDGTTERIGKPPDE